jgi:hypothetical protein
MAPVAIGSNTATQTIESLKQAVGGLTLNANGSLPDVNLREYASFDSTPSIGTEFKSSTKDGKSILDIRDVLNDDAKLKALGRLV